MSIRCTITDATVNGEPAVDVLIRDDANNRELRRKVRPLHRDEVDGLVDDTESAFGPAAAGDVRNLLDEAAKRVKADAALDPLADIVPIDAGDLLRDFPVLRKEVIHALLRETETMNVISTSKSRKTFTTMSLALAVATGRTWLGLFPVEQGDVLYIDAELHRNTSSRRLDWVAQAMGIMSEEFATALKVINLRGRLRDILQLGPFFARIPKGTYKLIVLDALYRLIPPRVDENSNSEMTPVYNAIDAYAEQTGAAIVVVHHASKGSQSGKSVTDVGAGAGAQSRATDSHVILRDHEEDDVVVMEAACRSFPPPPPVCLRWNFPTWTHEPDLDPADLRSDHRKKKRSDPTDETPKESKIPWTPERFVESFVSDEPKSQTVVLAKAELAMSAREAKRYLELAIDGGLAYRWIPANKRQPIRLATMPQPVTDTGGTP